mmetsp:Transcript_44422/g.108554  ORF Transcript_44422/g.108554 Transcript_44422/m.108554 type:complete len:111 (+) Transcript_44422:556-888(+)
MTRNVLDNLQGWFLADSMPRAQREAHDAMMRKMQTDYVTKLNKQGCGVFVNPAQYQCGVCGVAPSTLPSGKLLVCSKCKRTYYCGGECQKKDWEKHKPLCKKWRDEALGI